MKILKGNITNPAGYTASGISAGIKKSGKKDLAILFSRVPAICCSAFTQNNFAAPPVEWCRKIRAEEQLVRAIFVNSGIANACTGRKGHENCTLIAGKCSDVLNIPMDSIMLTSTGVIGQQLPMEKILPGIEKAAIELNIEGGEDFAEAILTTDLVKKEIAVSFEIDDTEIIIAGAAKGSGMIHPNMATMLAYITTDADIEKEVLEESFQKALKKSFNSITVDGDTSTNDSVFLLANSMAANDKITKKNGAKEFAEALEYVMTYLADAIVKDGEGATKICRIKTQNACSLEDAEKVSRAVANSSLVKTALFGNDPNWGRILCAAGYSGAKFDPTKTDLFIGSTLLVENGEPTDFNAKLVSGYLSAKEVEIKIDLKKGEYDFTATTCDLSYDYVKINAEYHT